MTERRMIRVQFNADDQHLDEHVDATQFEAFLSKHVNRHDEIADALLFLEVERMSKGRYVGAGWSVSFTAEDAE